MPLYLTDFRGSKATVTVNVSGINKRSRQFLVLDLEWELAAYFKRIWSTSQTNVRRKGSSICYNISFPTGVKRS